MNQSWNELAVFDKVPCPNICARIRNGTVNERKGVEQVKSKRIERSGYIKRAGTFKEELDGDSLCEEPSVEGSALKVYR